MNAPLWLVIPASPSTPRAGKAGLWFLPILLFVGLLCTAPPSAQAKIYVVENSQVGEYSLSGGSIKVPLITAVSNPRQLALDGTDLYVTSLGTGSIGLFSTGGATISGTLIGGLSSPEGVTIDGTNLYAVCNNGNVVGEYSLSGSAVSTSFVSVSGPYQCAISGTVMYVTTGVNGTVDTFSTVDGSESPSDPFISGLQYPTAIAASGTILYVGSFNGGVVGSYSTVTGSAISSQLIANLVEPSSITVDGSNVYVTTYGGSSGQGAVGVYTVDSSGTSVLSSTASLISNLNFPAGVAVDSGTEGGTGASGSMTTTLIAAKGDIGGKHDHSVLATAGPPAVDAFGDVAFHATVTGSNKNSTNDAGILFYSGTTPTIVVTTGTQQNIEGDVFTKVSDPVLSGSGVLAFLGTLKTGSQAGAGTVTGTNDSGIWVFQSGSATEAVRTGDPAPEGVNNFTVPIFFSSFTEIAINNAGGVSFLAGLKGKNVSTTGLFATDAGGNLQLLTAVGNPHQNAQNLAASMSPFVVLPLVGGQSRTIDTVSGNGSLLAKFGTQSGGSAEAIGLALTSTAGYTENLIAQVGGITIYSDTFATLSEPIVNANASAAFLSTVKGPHITSSMNTQMFIDIDGTDMEGVTTTGNFAPDTSGNNTSAVFSALSSPVVNNVDQYAFIATLKSGTGGVTSSNNSGIYSNVNGTFVEVARTGDSAPGGGKFSKFLQMVLPDASGPIFLADLTAVSGTANEGLYAAATSGSISKIVAKGDLLPVRNGAMKPVKSIGVFQQPPFALGQSRSFDASTGNIAYEATFTDGSWGIYLVTY